MTTLARRPDWALQLDALVYSRLRAPFRWGQHDCALFAADAVRAITGHDLASDLRQHTNARQAARTVARLGGLASIATRALGPACRPSEARQGDVVLVHQGKRVALGVAISSSCVAGPGPQGLHQLPMRLALCAWRVG